MLISLNVLTSISALHSYLTSLGAHHSHSCHRSLCSIMHIWAKTASHRRNGAAAFHILGMTFARLGVGLIGCLLVLFWWPDDWQLGNIVSETDHKLSWSAKASSATSLVRIFAMQTTCLVQATTAKFRGAYRNLTILTTTGGLAGVSTQASKNTSPRSFQSVYQDNILQNAMQFGSSISHRQAIAHNVSETHPQKGR